MVFRTYFKKVTVLMHWTIRLTDYIGYNGLGLTGYRTRVRVKLRVKVRGPI